MINHVTLQGWLYIKGFEDMRVERRGKPDVERRYYGHLTTGDEYENAWHNIRISCEHGADAIVKQWLQTRLDPTDSLETMAEGKLMTVHATGFAYVLIEYVRFIGTGNLMMRNGNFPTERRRRVGAALVNHDRPEARHSHEPSSPTDRTQSEPKSAGPRRL